MEALIQKIKNDQKVAETLEVLKEMEEETLAVQLELVQIKSPSNHEEARAKRFFELLNSLGLDEVHMDNVNNVIGLLKGTGNGPKLVLAAHLDTVFDMDTDCTPVKKDDGFLWAPGIGDDTRCLAEVYSVAKAMRKTGLRTSGDILFVGNVGEESIGDLRGTRNLFQTVTDIDGFFSADSSHFALIRNAIGGVKYRFTFTGKGGHALGDFGIPNVNNAMARAAAAIADIEVPAKPKTIFNVGVMNGGVSVNAIPAKAVMMVDLRSMSSDSLEELNRKVLAAVENGVKAENARWNHPTETVQYTTEVLSRRPGGDQPLESPLVQMAIAAYRSFGIEPKIPDGSSTDSNIPISMGIPALTLCMGGEAFGTHTVNEHYDPTDGYKGPQKDLVVLLAAGGLDGVCKGIVPVRGK